MSSHWPRAVTIESSLMNGVVRVTNLHRIKGMCVKFQYGTFKGSTGLK